MSFYKEDDDKLDLTFTGLILRDSVPAGDQIRALDFLTIDGNILISREESDFEIFNNSIVYHTTEYEANKAFYKFRAKWRGIYYFDMHKKDEDTTEPVFIKPNDIKLHRLAEDNLFSVLLNEDCPQPYQILFRGYMFASHRDYFSAKYNEVFL